MPETGNGTKQGRGRLERRFSVSAVARSPAIEITPVEQEHDGIYERVDSRDIEPALGVLLERVFSVDAPITIETRRIHRRSSCVSHTI